MALIKDYYSYLGQTSPGGDGKDYSWNQLPAGWTRIQNAQPQKGDILVYGWSAKNPAGHVAIYESDNSTWHQNFGSARYVTQVTYRYNSFDNPYWGVIRPDFSSATPTPSYADIGTNVYRYLIRTDGWKHIGTNYDSSDRYNVTIGSANTGDPEQIWKFIRQGDGSYCIQNMFNDNYLTYEGNCVQQAKVTTSWLNTNKASRFQWYIYDKNGTFQLVPKDSVTAGTWLVLDCTGNYQTPGTQMELYSNWSGAAQIFSLYPVDDYQKPAAPPKVEITVPEVVTVGEEVKISWTASPLRDKYDQREYCVTVQGGGSKKSYYTTDTSVSVTIKRRELHCNVTVESRNTKYANYSSSSYATFRCVEAHEHSYTAVVTPPTCTEKGYTTHTCSCGDSYVDTYTNALGHAWDNGKVTKEPTETETGVKTFTCTRCGETRTETMPVIPHVHSYKDVVTAPTCTEKGYTTHTCACGDSYVDAYVDALGHAWDNGKVTKEPTETETGVKTFTCTRCGETRTETMPVIPHVHSYKDVVTAPTCTEKGYTTHTCACGDSYVDAYVDALGHAWDNGKVTKEPTETETGVKTFTCTRCGETRTETMPVIPHVHSYKAVVTAPTCTAKGYTTHTCSCGDSYVDTYVDALGHAWGNGKVTKQPTATETGIRTYTCTRCHETKTESIPVVSVDVTQMFTDVTKNWAYPGIQYCVTHGIMGGMGDGTFAPTGTTTRAQIVQILYNLEGTPAVSGTTPFTDLTANWYKPAILWAYQNNVVAGTSPTTFAPDQPVTREQIAVILTQYMFHVLKMERTWTPADLSTFPDGAQVSGWAKEAMQDAVALGLINGTKAPDGKVYLDPQGSAARQQVATILMNFCQNVKK